MHYEVRCHCGRTMGHAPRLPAGYWRCGCGNMIRVVDQQHDACHGRGVGRCAPGLVVRHPIALCSNHVYELVETEAFMSNSVMEAQRLAYMRERDERAEKRERTEAEERQDREERFQDRRRQLLEEQSVVYYVTRGKLIKIGYTTNMTARMATLMPDSILATEPGGEQLERQRHKQFKHLRARELGREYFTNGDDLLIHIADVIAKHGPPHMTTWPKLEAQYYQ